MALEGKSERSAFTFIWKVENYSDRVGNYLSSPTFVVDTLNQTDWRLQLSWREYPQDIVCSLNRGSSGPEAVQIDLDIALLAADDTVRAEKRGISLQRNHHMFECLFIPPDEVFKSKRSVETTLILRCRIWRSDNTLTEGGQCFGITRVEEEHISLTWAIPDINTVTPNPRKTVSLASDSKGEGPRFTMSPTLSGGNGVAGVELWLTEINWFTDFLYSFQISVLDASGKKTHCTSLDYPVVFNISSHILLFPQIISKREMESDCDLWLPNGVLTLQCECFVLRNTVSQIESVLYGAQSLRPVSSTADVVPKTPKTCGAESSLSHDLKSLYEEGSFSDFQLLGTEKTFRVHKALLSARSPVFKAMLETDLKEKSAHSVTIPDVDDDALGEMLLFLYTESFAEDMPWEKASKLYSAADKYHLMSLKKKFRSSLKTSLSVPNACYQLVLAHMHNDDTLKEVVRDFIFSHDTEVIESPEFNALVRRDAELASETLLQLYRKVKKLR